MWVYFSGQGATPGQQWLLLSVLLISTTMRLSAPSGGKTTFVPPQFAREGGPSETQALPYPLIPSVAILDGEVL